MKKTQLNLTLDNESLNKLEKIKHLLSKQINFELSKSQVIQYLINNFKTETKPIQKESKKPIKTANQEIKKEPLNVKPINPYLADSLKESQRKINELKNILNLSIPKMSQALNISVGNLKHYLYGQRTPQGENADILREFYEKYGIN